ncbi:MAG: hypothetical protein SGI92_30595 [Bryobacteraceae bacterium]|nr:hypothetical protein [Bryobacteraceae bacterium]
MKMFLCFVFAVCVGAAQPRVTFVSNSADGLGWIAFGGLATMYGSGLSSSTASARAVPLPKVLGGVELLICAGVMFPDRPCPAAPLLYVSPDQINFQIPVDAPAFDANMYLRQNGTTSGPFRLSTIYNSAPTVFRMGYDCSIDPRFPDGGSPCGLNAAAKERRAPLRGAITDQAGSVVTSLKPARVGQYYSMWLTGVGRYATNGQPTSRISITLSDVPAYGYPNSTFTTAEISYIGPSSYPGLDQINFRIPLTIMGRTDVPYPPLHPCGDYRLELSIEVAAQGLNVIRDAPRLPVEIRRGDVLCAQ